VGVDDACATLAALAEAGIDEAAITRQLEEEALAVFVASYDELIAGVEEKRDKPRG